MNQTLSPFVRVAMDHWLHPGTYVDTRMIWDYELLFLKHGELLVTIEDETYRGSAGDIFLFKPKQTHSIHVYGEQPVEQPHVHFDLIQTSRSEQIPISFKTYEQMDPIEKTWFCEDLLSGPDLNLPNLIRLKDTTLFEEKLFEIIQEFQVKSPYYKLRLKALILELLVIVLREVEWQKTIEDSQSIKLLIEVQQYIQSNATRDMTLDELSKHFHLNKHYLIGLFKKAFCVTPIKYHQNLRIDRAKNLLQFSKLSIQEISDALGYPSIHAFSRAFKNSEHVSPSLFRKTMESGH